jgi:hypothetical protein
MAWFGLELGPRKLPVSWGGDGCCSGFLGETTTTTEQLLVVEAHVDAKGGFGVFGWH